MTDAAALYDRARQVGIPDADLPGEAPHPQRRLPLEGGLNFRDLGGYPTADGGSTRWGVLYRSDHLNTLTDTDVRLLDGLGLKRVHDLRLQKERDRQPSRLPEGVEVRHLAAMDLGMDETMVDVVQDVLAGRRPLPPPTFWDDNYEDMVERARPMFSALIDSITTDDDGIGAGVPSLFHCTGGKDRTGLAGVLLLELAGVDRAVAIDDFLLTNLYRTPVRAEALRQQLSEVGVDVADALPILGVTRSAMERALSVIDDRHGGVERYVVSSGARPDAAAALRRVLVDS